MIKIEVKELLQPNAIHWLNKPCWSLGEAHLLLNGFEPVSNRSFKFPPLAISGNDVDYIDRAILAQDILPLNNNNNEEPVYSPSELIRIAEEGNIGCWHIWSALLREKIIKERLDTTKDRERGDALTSIIEIAKRNASNPDDVSSVWAELRKLAEMEVGRPAQLLGLDDGAIKYLNNVGIVKFFTKKNLSDRLRRSKTR